MFLVCLTTFIYAKQMYTLWEDSLVSETTSGNVTQHKQLIYCHRLALGVTHIRKQWKI